MNENMETNKEGSKTTVYQPLSDEEVARTETEAEIWGRKIRELERERAGAVDLTSLKERLEKVMEEQPLSALAPDAGLGAHAHLLDTIFQHLFLKGCEQLDNTRTFATALRAQRQYIQTVESLRALGAEKINKSPNELMDGSHVPETKAE
jgi:hypothetical protein